MRDAQQHIGYTICFSVMIEMSGFVSPLGAYMGGLSPVTLVTCFLITLYSIVRN